MIALARAVHSAIARPFIDFVEITMKKCWTLLDLAQDPAADVVAPEQEITSAQLGLAGCRVQRQTLRGGLREGVELLTVDNGALRVALLPQRGMGLWKAWLGDLALGWNSPVRGPVHPGFVPIGEPSGLGWLDGFDELLCRCGLWSNGPPEYDSRGVLLHPVHGRIANLPAHRLVVEADAETGELSVTGVVDECRFHFHKLRLKSTLITRPGEPGVRIVDEVTNLSGNPGQMQLLYHINFGPPLLGPGARVSAAVRRMMPRDAGAVGGLSHWSRYGEPQAGAAEECYFFQLLGGADGRTRTLLHNAVGDRGVSLRFSTVQLPCFTLWKNSPAREDGYVTGLEPGANFPNPRSFEERQGRVRQLAPGETARFELAIEAHGDAQSVARAEAEIADLQAASAPEICKSPQPGWTVG
jgi:hypothetical protein